MNKINLQEKFNKISECWTPKIVAQLNNYHFKLAKIQGEFIWHKHEETDEAFIVIDGQMRMDYEDEQIVLEKDEMIVVPKGKNHRPYAEKETKILMIEPVETLNTGNIKDGFTKEHIEWI